MAKQYKSNESFIEHLVYTALVILNENDGRMLLSELREKVEEREGKNLSATLKEPDASGKPRWHHRFTSTAQSYVVAGYLVKSKGVWNITPKFESALAEKSEDEINKYARDEANAAPKRSKGQRDSKPSGTEGVDVDAEEEVSLDDHESTAKTAIKEYIRDMEPYQFQDLCAALLRGMGYYIPDIAARGADGGIDIVAYTDPLGGKPPRVKVQVKRYQGGSNISVDELDKLAGKIQDGEIGVFITSSGFTRDSKRSARDNSRHIELIDCERFIDLWVEHYGKLTEDDKQLLPLHPIYFLAKKK